MRTAFLVIALGPLVLAAPALGKSRTERVETELGRVAEIAGSGCAAASFTMPVDATRATEFEPGVGDQVGAFDPIVVTDVRLAAGQATWTVQPPADECALHADDPAWKWWTEERSWAARYMRRSLVVRATPRHGMTSIGGLRVDRHGRRNAPTIRRARRQFGRPSSMRRRYGVVCRVRWDRLGLLIDFVNLGGSNPCRAGFVQTGRVRGNWTAVVGDRPAVAPGTTDDYLEHRTIGWYGDTSATWTLAEIWLPYGDEGYSPSLSARLNTRGSVKGFEFWVGAGGE